jgi:hypothetical protein
MYIAHIMVVPYRLLRGMGSLHLANLLLTPQASQS